MATLGRGERRRRRAQEGFHTAVMRHDVTQLGTTALATPDTMRRGEELIAEDPDLRAYILSPYNPANDLHAGQFFTRGTLALAETAGWMRAGVWAIVLVMLLGCIAATSTMIGAMIARGRDWPVLFLGGGFGAGVSGLLAVAFLRRLLGTAGRR